VPEFILTGEQEEAAAAHWERIAITASAGSGKTVVLTERYVRHVVEGGLTPREILTLTFSRKAAAEMRGRIKKALRKAGRHGEAQMAETGPVLTIDAFIQRLLQEQALLARIDPSFDVMSGAKKTGALARSAQEALTLDSLSDESRWLMRQWAGERSDGGTRKGPYSGLIDAIAEVVTTIRGSGYSRETAKVKFESDHHLATLENALRNSLNEDDATKFAAATGSLKARLNASCKVRPSWLKSTVEDADPRLATGLLDLALDTWEILEAKMERDQCFDFAAMTERAVRLLEESDEAKRRIGERYKTILVDEAQDVSPIQHRLIDACNISEIVLIGDRQQSIYGWRDADIGLFQERVANSLARPLTQNLRSLPEIVQFVDRVFGRWWTDYQPMTPPPKPMDLNAERATTPSRVEVWNCPQADPDVIAKMTLKFAVRHSIPLDKIAILVRTAEFGEKVEKALKSIGQNARLVGGNRKFLTRLVVHDLANAMVAIADPQRDLTLLALLRSPFVGLSMDGIATLAKHSPVIEALGSNLQFSQVDWETLDKFRKWFDDLRTFGDRLSAIDALSHLLTASNFLESIAQEAGGPQAIANVRKLIRMAASEPELGPLEFAEQIRELRNLSHAEAEASVAERADEIQILTIHKAKGLDFEAVIVPETLRKPSTWGKSVYIEPRLGLLSIAVKRQETVLHKWLDQQTKAREQAEEERLMYVALTRPKKYLAVVASKQALPGTFGRRLHDCLGSGEGLFTVQTPES
jgi:ATP-dependent exoDNAse (exonuclease V) beta subunit